VVCDAADADRYRRLLDEGVQIESRLAADLDAHLNAEIATGTVDDIDGALSWLDTTFYAVRARADPERYGDDLRARARETLESLVDRGFAELDDDLRVEPTRLGRLASKYYLRLDTAGRFRDLTRRERLTDRDVLEAVAGAAEFDSVSCRQDERDAVGAVLTGVDHSLEGGNRKVLAILRASMTGSTPGELASDAWVIRQNARRLLAALRAVLEEFADPFAANIARRATARVETGVDGAAVGLTAIDGVGSGRAQALAAAGLTAPGAVLEAGVEGLVEAGLAEGVAERVLANARELPAVAVDWGGFPAVVPEGGRVMREATVRSTAGGARAGVRVTVDGNEMTHTTGYLGTRTVPVALFGAEPGEHELAVEVAFPELALPVHRETRTVRVD